MKKYDYIIGIDPDCDKSGMACLITEDKSISIDSFKFFDLFVYLKTLVELIEIKRFSYMIVIEAGWLNNSNWHLKLKDSKPVCALKGNAVGRNHETGRKIEEMCQYLGLDYELKKPLIKCWKGPNGKITHNEISSFIRGFPNQSNQEKRDAALIAWNYAGFEIKINKFK